MTTSSFRKDLGFLFLALTLFFGLFLGARPLSTPDEGRYAEIPREMALSGDLITPRLNGIKYFEKPPLFYWLESASIKLFGLGEFTLRFLPMLLGVFGCLLVYGAGRRLFGREAGIASALTLATSLLYYAHTRILILDIGVAVFMTGALLFYLLATQEKEKGFQNAFLVGFFSFSALAVLTKGLIGAVLPGAVILLWTLPFKRWKELSLAFKPWGVALFFALAAPWHLFVSLKNPEFFDFYFIHEHFTRFLTTEHGRYKPFFFFVPIFFGGLFPWVAFLGQVFQGVKEHFRSDRRFQFLVIAIGFIFLFFSLSKSKLIPYILPLFPLVSLLIGREIALLWEGKIADRRPFFIYVFLAVVLLIAVPIALYTQDLLFKRSLWPAVFLVEGILLGSALGVFLFVKSGGWKKALMTIGLSNAALFVTINTVWEEMEGRSIKPFALYINAHRTPDDEIVSYNRYYQDFPVYTNQTIKVVGWQGECTFGMKQEDVSSWMISMETLDHLWKGEKKVYMIGRKEALDAFAEKVDRKPLILLETERDRLVSNKE